MTELDLTAADVALEELHGKSLAEAARTYLLGVLEVDLPEDLEPTWSTGFDDEEERLRAEQALDEMDSSEQEALFRAAMRAALEEHPETANLFITSVEEAGQSMFVIEIAVVAIAAAVIIREHHTKGRKHVSRRKETVHPDGSRTVETEKIDYQSDSALAKLLVKLGLGA